VKRFAAIDFLLRLNRRLARRLRVHQWLLLVLRIVLVSAAATMMSQPFAETESDLPAVSAEAHSAVLILDDTMSMRRKAEGKTLFALALERAKEVVRLLGPQSEIALLVVSTPNGPLDELTQDRSRIGVLLSTLRPTFVHAKLRPAIAQAVRVLGQSRHPRGSIYVFSDMASHGRSHADTRVPSGTIVHLIDVARGLDTRNIAVVDLRAQESDAPGQRSTELTARICNFGSQPARAPLALVIDGQDMARGTVSLPGGGCVEKQFQHAFGRGGMHDATVSCAADDLTEDDTRYLRLEIQNDIRVLLVNGEPSPVRYRDELFYLTAALNTTSGSGQRLAAKVITLGEVGNVSMAGYDVVVLSNIRAFPARKQDELERFVKRGGGLFISLGKQTEPDAFNQSLGGLLPHRLRGAATTSPPGTGAPLLRFGRMDGGHPVIAMLWRAGDAGLRSAQFNTVFHMRPAPDDGRRRTVISFDDGSPALTEMTVGEGRVMLFASTIDRDWTDLPIRPGFLPLVQQIIRHLSHVPLMEHKRRVVAGGHLVLPVGRGAKELRLVGPDGRERSWSGSDLRDKETIEILAPMPGLYRLSSLSSTGQAKDMGRESFVANVDSTESDLRPAQTPGVTAAMQKIVRATRRTDLWHGVGVLLLLLVVLESFLTRHG
jgi:hypothetical protein